MNATDIHPKIAAAGTVGVIVTAVVSLLLAFGIAVPTAAIAPTILLVTLAAGYIKKSGVLYEYIGS